MQNQIPIPVSELKTALAGFTKVINRRTALPVLGSLRLTSQPNGPVRLQATNLDDFLTLTCQSPSPLEPFDALIPFGALAKIIRGYAPQELFTFVLQVKDLRVIHPAISSSLQERLEFIPVEEFPAFPPDQTCDLVPVGEEFKSALQTAFDCASEDSTRYIFQSAFVDVSDPKAHYVIGTDGRHLFSANSFHLGFKESLVLPHRKFVAWSGFMEDGDWQVGVIPPLDQKGRGFVKVQSSRWTLITAQIEGVYPNWRSALPSPNPEKTVIRFDSDAAQFIALAAPKLPRNEENERPVECFATECGSLILQANTKDQEVRVPVNGVAVQGRPVHFALNRGYLLKALKLGLTELEIIDPSTTLTFRNGGQRLLVAPLREPKAPEPTPSTPQPQTSPAQETQYSSPEPEIKPEEEPKEEMKTINRIEENQTAVQDRPETQAVSEPLPAIRLAMEQAEKVREALRGVLSDMNDLHKMLAQVQREKKASEREVEQVRETLVMLQRVRL